MRRISSTNSENRAKLALLAWRCPSSKRHPSRWWRACLRNAVEPEFDAAREREVGGIDGEHEPAFENSLGMDHSGSTNSMPSLRPKRVVNSSHSLTQENCWRR